MGEKKIVGMKKEQGEQSMRQKLHRIIRVINYILRFVKIFGFKQFLWAGLAGIFAVAGFAPWNIFPLPLVSLAILFWLWDQAENPKISFWIGFFFGLDRTPCATACRQWPVGPYSNAPSVALTSQGAKRAGRCRPGT